MVTTVKLQGEIANAGGMAVLHKEKSFFLTCRNTVCKITSAGRNFYHKNKMTILTSNRASYIVGWIGAEEGAFIDGAGRNACFNCPIGLAINQKTGTIFVADHSNNAIRNISFTGKVLYT